MKILLVGGDFNDKGGKESSLIWKMKNELFVLNNNIALFNGCPFSRIQYIFDNINNFDAVLWFPNIPNDKEKIRDIKEKYPNVLLVTSKRNDNQKYSFQELVSHALELKSNLFIEFIKEEKLFRFNLYDPLGNKYYGGSDIEELTTFLYNRLVFLKSITRQGTKRIGNDITIPKMIPQIDTFFKIIKDNAEVFHRLVQPPKEVNRFLGNASFRCDRGFPSYRSGNLIFVSKRNINKQYIDQNGFVAVDLSHFFDTGEIGYYGDAKPSVDTPIQIKLFAELPFINFILHSHVYAEGGVFTKMNVPCGGLEEVIEVMMAFYLNPETKHAIINLIGHGSLILSHDVEFFKTIKYYARPVPEEVTKHEVR